MFASQQVCAASCHSYLALFSKRRLSDCMPCINVPSDSARGDGSAR